MSEIEALLDQKKWKPAQTWLQKELLSSPTDHWLWFTLSLVYYEQKQYDLALKCSQRAVELKADCPLALWHYAGSLYMTGHEQAAFAIWTMLLEMDLDLIAYGECGEGLDHAMRLVNDIHYRVGHYFQHRGQNEMASKSFEKYLHNRAHGVTSTYDDRPVKQYLSDLQLAR